MLKKSRGAWRAEAGCLLIHADASLYICSRNQSIVDTEGVYGPGHRRAPAPSRAGPSRRHGREAQVDPIKPALKAPGTERLKLKYGELLSNVGFKFNLRGYTMVPQEINLLPFLTVLETVGGKTSIPLPQRAPAKVWYARVHTEASLTLSLSHPPHCRPSFVYCVYCHVY